MGIPSYFSHILKNHNVVKRLDHHKHKNNIDILLMDCNSIVYNVVYSLDTISNPYSLNINTIIIEEVFKEIEKHIEFINPNHLCIIAFDGVAPLAKMKQQRDRRYKSAIFNSYKKSNSNKCIFDTSQITPGTVFMNQLSKTLKHTFDAHKNSFKCNIKFTGTTDEGEGEHKLFEFIREFKTYCQKKTVYIYGLDSDLIILSLEHLKYTSNIVLYRDTFKKNADKSKKHNNKLQSNMFDIMDMSDFSQSILKEIELVNEQKPQQRITDYALLSFFLGNDFLPHSPILPIRTFGISELIRNYRNIVNNNIGYNYLTNKNKIIWSNIKSLCQIISLREKEYIKKEIYHLLNDNNANQKYKPKSEYIQDQKCRQSSICLIEPDYNGWQKRYYEYIFLSEPTDEFIKNICIKYLEGLQWCLYYYTDRCVDYKWVYPYYYPPLFSDLVKYIPEYSCELFDKKNIQNKITPLEQLTYVLPPTSYNLLPDSIRKMMLEYNENNTSFQNNILKIPLQTDFSTFLWESHPVYTPTPIEFVQSICEKYNE